MYREDDQEIYEGLEGDDLPPPVPTSTAQEVPPSLPAPLDHTLAPPLPSNRAASPASPKKTVKERAERGGEETEGAPTTRTASREGAKET